ncbi:hypothetical protein SISNIDRAFT_456449, partial [Sistotremastrum niveocremeum HHB9708]
MEILMPSSESDEPSRVFIQDAEAQLKEVISQTSDETSSLISRTTVYPHLINTTPRDERDPLMSAVSRLERIQATFTSSIGAQIANLKQHSNCRSPVLRLPDEILLEVFNICFMESEGEGYSDCDHPLEESGEIIFTLSHVCSAWRAVAFKARSFWSSVRMHWSMSRIETYASRCHPTPLDVIWTSSSSAVPQKVAFLLKRLGKINSLHVMLPGKQMADRFKSETILWRSLPNMKALTLAFPPQEPGEILDEDHVAAELFVGNAPHLRSLSLINITGEIYSPMFHELTTLRIRYTSVMDGDEKGSLKFSDIIYLLRESPNLEIFQFSIDHTTTALVMDSYPRESRTFKIRSLIVDSWTCISLRIFFLKFSFPLLENIKVTTAPADGNTEPEDTNMLSFLNDAPYNIRALLAAGRHLAIQGPIRGIKERGTSFTLSPSRDPSDSRSRSNSWSSKGSRPRPTVVLQPRCPDWGEREEQEHWHGWISFIFHTITLSRAYFPLSNLRSFAFNLNGPDYFVLESDDEVRCWEIFFEACVRLEELEILGLDTWQPMVRALGEVRHVQKPRLESNSRRHDGGGEEELSASSELGTVPCPSLRILRLLMQSVPDQRKYVLSHTLQARKQCGSMVQELIFVPYKAQYSSVSIEEDEESDSRSTLRDLEAFVGSARRVEMRDAEGKFTGVSILDGERGFDLVDGERNIC